ncbi:MAG: hypothetical protein JXB32_11610 [Deltaproteobacteria bacterium]|nr:hypothetical protein [Deltaproteobacteria bacterium]
MRSPGWLVAVLVAGACSRAGYRPPPPSVSGNAADLEQTEVVPTADSPMQPGKNVIWCASFQAAWAELKKALGGDPPGEQQLVRRLNAARMEPTDLPRNGWYAAAGRIGNGIVDEIRREMGGRFPGVTPQLASVGAAPDRLVAYAYLAGEVKFAHPYFDQKDGGDFVDATGRATRVRSFGLAETGSGSAVNRRLRDQIAVLYAVKGERDALLEFVLDLDRGSSSQQLLLAVVEPEETLAATWTAVRERIAGWHGSDYDREFGVEDRLAVPNINFDLDRRYDELVQDNDFMLEWAGQRIRFRLDRSGAEVADESNLVAASLPRYFSFTRPFLVALRNRGTEEPYFLMWVANAELLDELAADGR